MWLNRPSEQGYRTVSFPTHSYITVVAREAKKWMSLPGCAQNMDSSTFSQQEEGGTLEERVKERTRIKRHNASQLLIFIAYHITLTILGLSWPPTLYTCNFFQRDYRMTSKWRNMHEYLFWMNILKWCLHVPEPGALTCVITKLCPAQGKALQTPGTRMIQSSSSVKWKGLEEIEN